MPKLSEADVMKAKRALRFEGRSKGFSGKRLDTYVFGGLRKIGWKPKREKR